MKGSQASMESAIKLMTRNAAYIAKSRKSLFIPLLDLIEGAGLLYGLLLPALLGGQPKVVTVPAAVVAQLLTTLALRLPAHRKQRGSLRQGILHQTNTNSWLRRKEDASMEIETLLQQPKESKSHYQQMQAKHSFNTPFKC